MRKIGTAFSALLASAFVAPQANAALLGQTITYCTNSVYDGAVTLDPAACDSSVVGAAGTTTIVDPGVEFSIPNRFIDFTDTQLIITYNPPNGSASPDLYVVTGLSGITGVSLFGADPLGVDLVFSSSAIGFLVADMPTGPGTTIFNISVGNAIPEPTTWALLILGFGAIGRAMRRSKRTVRVSFA